MDINDLYNVLTDIRDNQSNAIDALWSIHSALTDIHSKLEDIQGSGVYNQISDVCSKLDDVESAINGISLI